MMNIKEEVIRYDRTDINKPWNYGRRGARYL